MIKLTRFDHGFALGVFYSAVWWQGLAVWKWDLLQAALAVFIGTVLLLALDRLSKHFAKGT